jgi:glycosyltransferase involved in cell wall biosynthesis
MITFAIPTWNRADKLEICIKSMLDQIIDGGHRDVKISVFNNASTDNTEKVLKEYKYSFPEIISYKTGIEHVNCQESFKQAFLMPETEYMWTFGDDDILYENGLNVVINLLKKYDLSFVHGAEFNRVSNEHRTYRASLLELCSGFGFIEMTGFISGNIFKSKPLQDVINSSDYEIYKKSAYSHSLLIMDAFADHNAAFINAPIVDLQDRVQTATTCTRWNEENTSLNYTYTGGGIERLLQKKRIPEVLPDDFFRYLSVNLFTKILYNFYDHSNSYTVKIDQDLWDNVRKLAITLREEERERMLSQIDKFKLSLDAYVDSKLATNELLIKVQESHDPVTQVVYPDSYT